MLKVLDRRVASLVVTILCVIAIGGCAHRSSDIPELFSFRYDSSLSKSNLALIIPGMNQKCSDPGYDSVGTFYKTIGILPVYVNINWKAAGIKNLTNVAYHINNMLKDSFPKSHFYLFGFSFGAVITLKLSQLINAEQIVLCSMSPLFVEDRDHQCFPFRQLLSIVADYSKNGLSYTSSNKTCVVFLYGDHDSFVINKAIIQFRKDFFTCSKTTIIPDARHNINCSSYLSTIRKTILEVNK
jgi:hypothetical protein